MYTVHEYWTDTILFCRSSLRLVFRRTQHHITAEVYSSDSVDPVLSCSTKEWALKRELGTTRSVTACRAVGEVLAQRCLEAGITRMVYREVPWKFRSESVSFFSSIIFLRYYTLMVEMHRLIHAIFSHCRIRRSGQPWKRVASYLVNQEENSFELQHLFF